MFVVILVVAGFDSVIFKATLFLPLEGENSMLRGQTVLGWPFDLFKRGTENGKESTHGNSGSAEFLKTHNYLKILYQNSEPTWSGCCGVVCSV